MRLFRGRPAAYNNSYENAPLDANDLPMTRDTATAPLENNFDDFTCRTLSHARVFFARGDAPAILFIHGGFHGAWCWSKVLTFLASRGVGAAAIDLRGHGGLPQSATFVVEGFDDMVADVIEAVRTLPGRVFLAGHSLGALIAMKAAEEIAPHGLILLAPATPAGVAKSHALPSFPAGRAILPPDEARTRKWFLSGDTSPSIARYRARLCPESPKLLNDCFHDGIAIERERIACPILCLSGAKDDSPLHPAGQDQTIAVRYGASLQAVEASGHCLMLDDGWRETAGAIHAWIAAGT
jgi:pimeloyl-ACP methyl ester carboxylesterase